MAAAGRRWQRCSSCGCRLMSASGQRLCWRSHGRGHHLPGRSTSIRALWRTAWLHESACWAVAVERWARRGATRRRKGLFQPFVRYLTHLDLASATNKREPWALPRETHFTFTVLLVHSYPPSSGQQPSRSSVLAGTSLLTHLPRFQRSGSQGTS